MDPASAAVALLAPYLARAGESFAAEAGDAAFGRTKALFAAIRRRFRTARDQDAIAELERWQGDPTDRALQETMKALIQKHAASDRDFADEVRQLVEAATNGQPVATFLTATYGGSVGKIVNIETAGTVNID